MPLVSVRIAAELAGKDRSTITRAIESGKLSASKDEHGRYRIDPAELERVFGSLHTPAPMRADATPHASHEDARAMHAAALEREAGLLREMLERERADRERERQAFEEERSFLRDLIAKHTDQIKLLTDQRQASPAPADGAPRSGWWRRMLGKS